MDSVLQAASKCRSMVQTQRQRHPSDTTVAQKRILEGIGVAHPCRLVSAAYGPPALRNVSSVSRMQVPEHWQNVAAAPTELQQYPPYVTKIVAAEFLVDLAGAAGISVTLAEHFLEAAGLTLRLQHLAHHCPSATVLQWTRGVALRTVS